MRSETLGTVVRRLRYAVAPPVAPTGPDADLVQAFAGRRDAAAFEAIVRRHGPMVLGVCRRVLRDPADADDAFQATFLVLVRKAATLRQPDRLAGWLHQVAHRTARKLRAIRLARSRREAELFDVPAGEPPADIVWRELRPVFDQELNRLPDKLRLPAVLCFLEGHSKGEAARTLGWPEGTLAGRLQQAREKLRARFAARGLTLSAGALAVALFEGVGSAAVPDRLMAITLQGVPNPVAAAGVRALADGVTQAMFLTKVKAAAAAALMAGAVGTGTGVVLVPGAGPGEVVARETPKDPDKAARAVANGAAEKARAEIDKARIENALAEIDRRKAAEQASIATEKLRAVMTKNIQNLRNEAEEAARLFKLQAIRADELKVVQDKLAAAEAELRNLGGEPGAEQSVQRRDLELLKERQPDVLRTRMSEWKDRLAFEEKLVAKGFLTQAELQKTKAELARAEADLAKFDAPKPADPRRAALEELIQKADEIVAKTADGVKRGIVPELELLNTEMTVLSYKLKLLELAGPSPADARERDRRRAAAEAVIRKAEQIVARMAEGVRRGIIPEKELLNAEMKLQVYKVKATELQAQPPTDPRDLEQRRVAMEATVRKLEEIVAKTAEGVRRGIVPHQELLNSELTLLRYKFELAELAPRPAADPGRAALEELVAELQQIVDATQERVRKGTAPVAELVNAQATLARFQDALAKLKAGPSDPRLERSVMDRRAAAMENRKAMITQKEAELRRGERLLKENAISQEEIRRLRIDLARLKAEVAEAAGDHAAAVTHRDGVVAEWEAFVGQARKLLDSKVNSQARVRSVEVALAEARVQALHAAARKQLADIVQLREKELADAKKLFESKAASIQDLRTAEMQLHQARLRLAEGR